MTTSSFLIEPTVESTPNNVVPFPYARLNPRGLGTRPLRSLDIGRTSAKNAVDLESQEQRLARRVERVLWALLYHALLEPGDVRGSKSFSIEKRVSQLASQDRLIAIARAAIHLGMTADLTRLAAAVIVFELQTQSRWWNRLTRLCLAKRRQIRSDALAIARLLASDMEALKVRPIDRFAQSVF